MAATNGNAQDHGELAVGGGAFAAGGQAEVMGKGRSRP